MQPYQGQPYPGQQQDPSAGQLPYPPQGQYPQAPYPQAAYPQAPYPQGGGQQAPYLQGPQQPPYPPADSQPISGQPPQKAKGKGAVILGITAGVAVLAVIAAFLLPGTGVTQVGAPVPSGSATIAVQTATAESAVQGYLEALAKADAATALAYAAVPPSDTSMLTNEVLAAGNATAPLSDIQVSPGSGSSSSDTVEASYRLGDRTVSASFPVSKVGSGWLLERPVATVRLSAMQPDLLALRLNGAPVTTETLEVFPGAYAVTSDDTRYAVTGGAFLVKSPDDRPDTYSMQVALSDAGRSLVRAAAQKQLSSCVAKRSLKPAGCGFGTRLPSGNKARTSTIRWTITKGSTAMKKLKPSVESSDPTQVRASASVQLKVTFRSTNGRSWIGYSSFYIVRADLSGSGVKVTLG